MTRTNDTTSTESVAAMPATEIPTEGDFGDQYSKMVIDLIDGLVLNLDLAGHIMTCNPAVERHTGFTRSELQGGLFESTFFPSDEVKPLQDLLNQLRKGERQLEWEADIQTKDGQCRRIRWTYSLVFGEQDEPSSIVAVGTDITAEWTLQAAERQTEEPEDRRCQPRQQFRYHQLIAPLVDENRLDQHIFCEVRCRDISANGFSYISQIVPQHRELVVAFGTPPSLTYITAEVVHISPVEIDGKKANVIGCHYTGRMPT